MCLLVPSCQIIVAKHLESYNMKESVCEPEYYAKWPLLEKSYFHVHKSSFMIESNQSAVRFALDTCFSYFLTPQKSLSLPR